MNKIKLEYLNELSGGDADFVASMLKTYVEETGSELQFLEEAFKKKDRSRISFWSHKIKTSFQMMGLLQLSKTAAELEEKAKNMDLDVDLMLLDLNFIISNAADSFGQAKRLIEDF
jgi:HPt (histidine-containing phosphotransfer) domain-containing protein